MSIEKNIERIADALEKLVKTQTGAKPVYQGIRVVELSGSEIEKTNEKMGEELNKQLNPTTEEVTTPKEEKPKRTRKSTAKPVVDFEDLQDLAKEDAPEEVKEVSTDEAREALKQFIAKNNNDVTKAKDILIGLKASKVSDLTPEQRVALVEAIRKA